MSEATPSSQHCPDVALLAASVDGMLSSEEQERVMSHVADCEACYEVFTGTLRFRSGNERAPEGPTRKRSFSPDFLLLAEPPRRWFSPTIGGVAVAATLVFAVAGVFSLLNHGQSAFRRAPEVADVMANARAALSRVSQDLTNAGFGVPAPVAVSPYDAPDSASHGITIVYANSDFPEAPVRPCRTGDGNPCENVENLRSVALELDGPVPWPPGTTLLAYETGDCNGDGMLGMAPIRRLQPSAEQQTAGTLEYELNDRIVSEAPELFVGEVSVNCAKIVAAHLVQYRVQDTFVRRDLMYDEEWSPVASGIDNFQIRYFLHGAETELDHVPRPDPSDPATWITRVQVTITGKTESANLEGATGGVFPAEDTFLRRTFTTTVVLRNVLARIQAAEN